MTSAAATPSMRVRRLKDRQSEDPAVLAEILREGLVAHVGLVRDGLPVVLPFLCGPGDLGAGPVLLLHGSTGGGLFLDGAAGVPIAATITHLDGLVFARSTFDSSANYRSAMIFGDAVAVPLELRAEALRQVADHLMPGRRGEVREMTPREVAATQVLQVPLETVSVKVRSAGAGEAPEDGEDHAVWAGVLPVSLQAGTPLPSPQSSRPDAVPRSVDDLRHALLARAAGRAERLLATTRAAAG